MTSNPIDHRPGPSDVVVLVAHGSRNPLVAVDGTKRIFVLPHFLNSGNHVLVDLPRIVDRITNAV